MATTFDLCVVRVGCGKKIKLGCITMHAWFPSLFAKHALMCITFVLFILIVLS